MIDLKELVGFTADVALPASGLLNFFYKADEQQACKGDTSRPGPGEPDPCSIE